MRPGFMKLNRVNKVSVKLIQAKFGITNGSDIYEESMVLFSGKQELSVACFYLYWTGV